MHLGIDSKAPADAHRTGESMAGGQSAMAKELTGDARASLQRASHNEFDHELEIDARVVE